MGRRVTIEGTPLELEALEKWVREGRELNYVFSVLTPNERKALNRFHTRLTNKMADEF